MFTTPRAAGRQRRRSLTRFALVAMVLALLASACQFDPASFADTPALSECLGEQATIGIGWHADLDGVSGSSYIGTEGDDVVVITNGPVRFDGLGGDDLICVNDTGMVSSTPPVVIDAGAGDDQVWDRRYGQGGTPTGTLGGAPAGARRGPRCGR